MVLSTNYLKYGSLGLLVGQTVSVILVLRYGLIMETEKRQIKSTVVVCCEFLKLISSFLLLSLEVGSFKIAIQKIRTEVLHRPLETLKVGFPAFLYTVQNNLQLIALSSMSGALYQVTYQLKTLTTAVLSVIILKKKLANEKWAALFLLMAGAALINMGPNDSLDGSKQLLVGLVAVLAACWTSGFAGVYFEKILKESKTSIWVRNIQLAIYGVFLGLIYTFVYDGHLIRDGGFFQGYNSIIWLGVALQGGGGLIVAMVLKYADNLLKCFGNACAIALSCLCSYYILGDIQISYYFVLGTALVTLATLLYSLGLESLQSLVSGSRRNSANNYVKATEVGVSESQEFREKPV